jgi:hypothetical protein
MDYKKRQLKIRCQELADKIDSGGEMVVRLGWEYVYCYKVPPVSGEATFLWKKTYEDFLNNEDVF